MASNALVLVVEDEEVVRKILAALIEDLGHRVLQAQDAHEALPLLRAHEGRVDLVMADKNLPGPSGLEVLKAAKVHAPDAQLMLVTGYPSYESAVEALRLGVCEYMEKPFLDLKIIQGRVTYALEQRAQRAKDAALLAARLVEALEDYAPPHPGLPHARAALMALKGS